MRSSILARIPGFRQRIIPEPRVPSRGSQAQGTRLGCPRAKRKSRIPARQVAGNRWEFFSDSQQAFRARIRLFRFAREQPLLN
jgi:hypothetical protein